MKLSAVIPAHNEEGSIAETVGGIVTAMEREGIDYAVFGMTKTGVRSRIPAPGRGRPPRRRRF
jgi:hypothetical protein